MVSALQQQVFEILPCVKDCNSKAPFLLKFPHVPQADESVFDVLMLHFVLPLLQSSLGVILNICLSH